MQVVFQVEFKTVFQGWYLLFRKAGLIMHTRSSLMKQLEKMGIDPQGTLLVHSSLKSIGEVEGEQIPYWMSSQNI